MLTAIGAEKILCKMKNLAIIPARGGSKRIPRKNIKDFLGKPIIAYSIEAALQSGLYEEVMVSTDDEEIANIAKEYGAKVPFLRSAETANDFETTADVINEVLNCYEQMGQQFDTFTCIYSTAPFVSSERLKEAYTMVKDDIYSVFTCVGYSYPIQRALHIVDGKISMLQPEYLKSRSQDLEPTYHDAGQFYVCTVADFKKNNTLWGPNTAGLVLSELEVQDLDTLTDWQLAEIKYKLTRC